MIREKLLRISLPTTHLPLVLRQDDTIATVLLWMHNLRTGTKTMRTIVTSGFLALLFLAGTMYGLSQSAVNDERCIELRKKYNNDRRAALSAESGMRQKDCHQGIFCMMNGADKAYEEVDRCFEKVPGMY